MNRVVILGAGAIGASVGALLHEAGVSVVLVARGAHGDALRAGVDLRFPHGSRRVHVPVGTLAEVTSDDLVVVSTMGHHTAEAIRDLEPGIPVVSLQNGIPPLDLLAAGHPTLAGVVWVPAERRGPGVIALPADPVPGTILVGPWVPPPQVHPFCPDLILPSRSVGVETGPWAAETGPWFADRLVAAGFRAAYEPDIAPWVRAKLLTNLGGVVVALCDDPPPEVVAAAQAEAEAVWTTAGLPFATVAQLLARVGPLEQLPVDGRERRGGSTRSALERGEPLETAALHGPIVTLGRALGLATPVNDALVREAERAFAEGRSPGSMSGADLIRRVGLRVG